MSKKSALPAPRARSSEDKLYQACLQACIEGIENLPVNKRQASLTLNHNNIPTPTTTTQLTPTETDNDTPMESAVTPSHQQESAFLLLSPRATFQRKSLITRVLSPASDDTMNRTPLHDAPVRGQAAPPRDPARPMSSRFGSQDARGNLAVQPVANAGSFKLKKNAVKIVSAPASSSLFRAPSVAPTAGGPSPAPSAVKAKPKEVDCPGLIRPAAKPEPPVSASAPAVPRVDRPVPTVREESALDNLFARLNARASPSPLSAATKVEDPATPRSELFTFEPPNSANVAPTTPKKEADLIKRTVKKSAVKNKEEKTSFTQADIEMMYLENAAAYLKALPKVENVAVQTLKAVSTKLQSSYARNTRLSVDEIEKLKARYAFAILQFVKETVKKDAKPVNTGSIKKILQESNGNMLALYAKLVDEEYLSLEDMDGLSTLCRLILDILPKADLSAPAVPKDLKPAATATSMATTETKPVSKDPMNNVESWPSQEKRENPAAYRACILKGVSGVKSINELQALVWGGRLDSIALPAPGADWAVVKFLTPMACDKYFKATENGIEIHGDKKALVFVEKQPGPSSINDVINDCIEGDASRCVRALDAEDDWSPMMLMKLASGKGTLKREVDRIKHGKTARGRHYIEFRFATIYHALNFKRQLIDNPDWEHCTISYATDPCETARGVHYKDEDEEGAGFFA